MKMTSQNQETTRTSKMNESNINNFPNLIQKNIRIKEYETSLDIGDSIYSVNSLPKNKIGKSLIDVDISLNSNNLKEIEKEKEKEENDNKNNKDLIKIINESNNKNNYITRNKILNTGNSSLNTLSTQFDNSKYFLTKTNANLILSNKIKKNPNENKNNINMNLKLTINEESNNKVKEIGTNNINKLQKLKLIKSKQNTIEIKALKKHEDKNKKKISMNLIKEKEKAIETLENKISNIQNEYQNYKAKKEKEINDMKNRVSILLDKVNILEKKKVLLKDYNELKEKSNKYDDLIVKYKKLKKIVDEKWC